MWNSSTKRHFRYKNLLHSSKIHPNKIFRNYYHKDYKRLMNDNLNPVIQ